MPRIDGAAADHSIPEAGQDTLPQGRLPAFQKKKKKVLAANSMKCSYLTDTRKKSHTKAQHMHESDMLFAKMNDETSFLGTPSSP